MSLSATVINTIKKIHELSGQPELRQQKVLFLQELIQRSMATHAKVLAEAKKSVSEDDTLNGKDKDGLTPLMWAAKLGLTDVMAMLIAGHPIHVPGASFDAVDKSGRTVLHHAADAGQLEAVRFLCSDERGRRLLEQADTAANRTPLLAAVSRHRVEVVKYLVQEQKAAVSATVVIKGGRNTTSIPIIAHLLNPVHSTYGEKAEDAKLDEERVVACLEILCDAKADVNARIVEEPHKKDSFFNDTTYESPLNIAAGRGLSQVVDSLVKHGADVSSEQTINFCGRFTPFACALGCFRRHELSIQQCAKVFEALFGGNPEPKVIESAFKDAISMALHGDSRVGRAPSSEGLCALFSVPQFLAMFSSQPQYIRKVAEYFDSEKINIVIQHMLEYKAMTQAMFNEAIVATGKRGSVATVKLFCEMKQFVLEQKSLNQALVNAIDETHGSWQRVEKLALYIQHGALPTLRGKKEGKTIFDVAIEADEYKSHGMKSLRILLALPQIKESAEARALVQEIVQNLKRKAPNEDRHGIYSQPADFIRVFDEFGFGGVGGPAVHGAPVSRPTDRAPAKAASAAAGGAGAGVQPATAAGAGAAAARRL